VLPCRCQQWEKIPHGENCCALWLTDAFKQRTGVENRARNYFAHEIVRRILGYRDW
jgi:hypothetical protein